MTTSAATTVTQQLALLEARGAEAMAAQLIMPTLDLRKAEGLELESASRLVACWPFAGFIIFGGELGQVRRITRSLERLAGHKGSPKLLFASDLERGLGQIVSGGSLMPPLAALAGLDDAEAWAFEMGAAIAHESLAVGIDWPFTPVLDLSDHSENPIIGSRAFSADPELTARLGSAYIRGVESTGALSCGKHFCGHGGTLEDSHDTLPTVSHDAARMRARDLLPFQAAIDAGVSSLMTAHVAYPGLSAQPEAGLPATLDPSLLRDLLRRDMGFDGLVISDAFIMDGLLEACGGDEPRAAVAALEAGCDIVLMPTDPEQTLKAIAAAIEARGADFVRPSLRRVLERKSQPTPAPRQDGLAMAEAFADRMARAVTRAPDRKPKPAAALRVVVIDDDDEVETAIDFISTLREAGRELAVSYTSASDVATRAASLKASLADDDRTPLFVVRCSIRAWKGRPGLHPELSALLAELLASAPTDAVLVALCGAAVIAPFEHPNTVVAHSVGPACEAAAARALL